MIRRLIELPSQLLDQSPPVNFRLSCRAALSVEQSTESRFWSQAWEADWDLG